MIRTKLFQKHYIVTVGALVGSIVVTLFVNDRIMRSTRPQMPSPTFFAKLVDFIDHENPKRALEQVEKMGTESLPFRFFLLDQSGTVVSPENTSSPLDWSKVQAPKVAYENTVIASTLKFGPPMGSNLIRLGGSGKYYLYVDFDPQKGPGPPPLWTLVLLLTSLFLSVLVGVGLAMAFLFRSLEEKVQLADMVIADLQSGNLKARFPIRKMDEFGQAMDRFNQMAAEIERLVDELKLTEASRVTLLQELAHDLRTPIASLKNLLETLCLKKEQLSPEIQRELLDLSIKEVDYFERLVEDLLVLAQVSEPRYQPDQSTLSISRLLTEEAEGVSASRKFSEDRIQLDLQIPQEPVNVLGDQHLIRRMFRNALENSFSFAKKQVRVVASLTENGNVVVVFEDDGPGFSEDGLKNFGNRRISRIEAKRPDGKLSVGLGTVIMKTVAMLLRGSLKAENRKDREGNVLGANVEIQLPLKKS